MPPTFFVVSFFLRAEKILFVSSLTLISYNTHLSSKCCTAWHLRRFSIQALDNWHFHFGLCRKWLITNAFTEMRCITPPRSALKYFRIWRPIQLVLGLNPSFAKSVITEEPYTTSPRSASDMLNFYYLFTRLILDKWI